MAAGKTTKKPKEKETDLINVSPWGFIGFSRPLALYAIAQAEELQKEKR